MHPAGGHHLASKVAAKVKLASKIGDSREQKCSAFSGHLTNYSGVFFFGGGGHVNFQEEVICFMIWIQTLL